jgi:hypothetical protein
MVSGYNDITLTIKCNNAITQAAKKNISNKNKFRVAMNTQNKTLQSSVRGAATRNKLLLVKMLKKKLFVLNDPVTACIKVYTSPAALRTPKTKITISQPPNARYETTLFSIHFS